MLWQVFTVLKTPLMSLYFTSKEQDLFVFIKVLLRNSYIKQDALWRSSKVFLWTLAAYLVIFSLGVVPDHFPRNVVFGVFC